MIQDTIIASVVASSLIIVQTIQGRNYSEEECHEFVKEILKSINTVYAGLILTDPD